MASCTEFGSIHVWDLQSTLRKPIYTYEDPKKQAFTCLSISSFRPVFMACSSMDSSITFFDIGEKKYTHHINLESSKAYVLKNNSLRFVSIKMDKSLQPGGSMVEL